MGGSVGGALSAINPVTVIANAGTTIGAGLYGMDQLDKGASSAQKWQNKANELYQQLYGDTQAGYKPYMEGGTDAFSALLKSYGLGGEGGAPDYSGFENSPDYLFALQQGEKAISRKQSATGNRLSPSSYMELMQFNQGLSSQNLGNYRSGLAGISGMGMDATNSLANYRMGYGNQLGQGYTNKGDIEMARRLGRANMGFQMANGLQDMMGMSGGGASRQSTYG
jgi:hypothetical protein